MTLPAFLSTRELAAKLDVSYDDVLSWTRRGLIPSIKSGGSYYYKLDKVLKAIRALDQAEGAKVQEGE